MNLSAREKFSLFINITVSVAIAIKYTLKISFTDITPNFDVWLMLVFLHLFTTMLFGTPLFCIYKAICFNQKSSIDNEQFMSCSAFVSIGIATAYTMLLYLFGLTSEFFSFAFS